MCLQQIRDTVNRSDRSCVVRWRDVCGARLGLVQPNLGVGHGMAKQILGYHAERIFVNQEYVFALCEFGVRQVMHRCEIWGFGYPIFARDTL